MSAKDRSAERNGQLSLRGGWLFLFLFGFLHKLGGSALFGTVRIFFIALRNSSNASGNQTAECQREVAKAVALHKFQQRNKGCKYLLLPLLHLGRDTLRLSEAERLLRCSSTT